MDTVLLLDTNNVRQRSEQVMKGSPAPARGMGRGLPAAAAA